MTARRRATIALQIKNAEDCPDIEKHTACPSGYLAWHEWAEKMSKTHKQKRCPTCGLWTIWEPK